MEKKNIGMKITIVILSLLVVGLSSYIVYDKVLSNDNNTTNNNNDNNDIKIESDIVGLEKLMSGYWWKKDTDKYLRFYDNNFSIARNGKGCGPANGCGSGVINSIINAGNNTYDVEFVWDNGVDESINYLATIDISNIDNNTIKLIGFYTMNNDDSKTKLIEIPEEYVFAGISFNEFVNYAFGN